MFKYKLIFALDFGPIENSKRIQYCYFLFLPYYPHSNIIPHLKHNNKNLIARCAILHT